MRTTVTLDPDVEALVKRAMREEGLSFKEALNQAIRAGLAPAHRAGKPFPQRTFAMGANPRVPYDRVLRLAGELEADEIIRELSRGK